MVGEFAQQFKLATIRKQLGLPSDNIFTRILDKWKKRKDRHVYDNPECTIPTDEPELEKTVGPILAYRCWKVEGSKLGSVVTNAVWEAGVPMEGKPGVGMEGVYGFKNVEDLANSSFNKNYQFAFGGVWLWGVTEVCERGYRSEFGYPAFLLYMRDKPFSNKQGKDFSTIFNYKWWEMSETRYRNIADKYDIPILRNYDDNIPTINLPEDRVQSLLFNKTSTVEK